MKFVLVLLGTQWVGSHFPASAPVGVTASPGRAAQQPEAGSGRSRTAIRAMKIHPHTHVGGATGSSCRTRPPPGEGEGGRPASGSQKKGGLADPHAPTLAVSSPPPPPNHPFPNPLRPRLPPTSSQPSTYPPASWGGGQVRADPHAPPFSPSCCRHPLLSLNLPPPHSLSAPDCQPPLPKPLPPASWEVFGLRSLLKTFFFVSYSFFQVGIENRRKVFIARTHPVLCSFKASRSSVRGVLPRLRYLGNNVHIQTTAQVLILIPANHTPLPPPLQAQGG